MKNSKTLLVLEIIFSGIFLWLVKVSHFDAGIFRVETVSHFILFVLSITGALATGKYVASWVYIIFDNIISLLKK